MIERPRLIPAVILGAMGLLALKVLAWTSEPKTARPSAGIPSAQAQPLVPPGKAEPEIWGLAKVIARAHAPDTFLDPETTGTIEKAKPKSEEELKAEAARSAGAGNRADVLNGTARQSSPAERAILERLGERREEIEARMRELDMRERLLDSAEKKLDGRLGDLKQLEDKVDGPKAKQAEDEAKAIKNLVIMYETMKPKDAAKVFDRLSLVVLVPVVQQMNPRKMSDVLAAMSPEAAEKLTVALANVARTPVLPRMVSEPAPLPGNELPAVALPQRR